MTFLRKNHIGPIRLAVLTRMLVADDRAGSINQSNNQVLYQQSLISKQRAMERERIRKEDENRRQIQDFARRYAKSNCSRGNGPRTSSSTVWDKKPSWDATSPTYLKGNFGGLF